MVFMLHTQCELFARVLNPRGATTLVAMLIQQTQPAKCYCADPCICSSAKKPVCGKDGTTYPNECVIKCYNVKIDLYQKCPENQEARVVWQVFDKDTQKWMTWLPTSWDLVARTPIFHRTIKKVTGSTTASYKFYFLNECFVKVDYDTSLKKSKMDSSQCPKDKCIDEKNKVLLFKAFYNVKNLASWNQA